MIQSSDPNRLSQGLRDVEEWRSFLHSHGKADYRVLMDCDPYAKVDVLQITPTGKMQHVELKMRRISISAYNDCLIEATKIGHLQAIDQEGEAAYVAVMYPTDNKIAVWRIKADEDYEIVNKVCNAVSIQSDPTTKVTKRMVSLKLADAVISNHIFANGVVSVA